MAVKIENSYGTILNSVRSSGLHFCLQETPFSCYITVRKSLINPNNVSDPEPPNSTNLKTHPELEQLRSRNIFLENSNLNIQKSFQDALEESEERGIAIDKFESEIKALKEELHKVVTEDKKVVEDRLKTITSEKKVLQTKNENVCTEIRTLKAEKSDLKKELNASNVALKGRDKEIKENNLKFKKQLEKVELKINTLEEYKIKKTAEERELKVKLKKADKKLKSVFDREAKLNLIKIKSIKNCEDD